MRQVKRYPILPKSKAKPIGGAAIVDAYQREAVRRVQEAKAEVMAIVERLPVYEANAVLVEVTPDMLGRYRWMLDDTALSDMAVAIQSAIGKWYSEGGNDAPWQQNRIAAGFEYGAGQSLANLSALSEGYALSTSIEYLMTTPQVVSAIGVATLQSYEAWNGFAADTRRELAQIIGQGIAQGLNPRVVGEQIAERFAIAESRAASIAQTEVLGAIRQARLIAAEDAEKRLGLKIGLLWTSAMKSTTRANHASRHGKTYSRQQVDAFYSTDGNRYNCYCAQTEVLLDEEGKPIMRQQRLDKMAEEKADWEGG